MLEPFRFVVTSPPPRGTPRHPTQAAQRRSLRRSRAPPSGGPSPSDPCPSRDCQISVLEASRGRAVAASDALPSGRRPPRHSVAATATLPATDLPSRLRQLIPIPRSIPSQPCGRCPPRIIAACKGPLIGSSSQSYVVFQPCGRCPPRIIAACKGPLNIHPPTPEVSSARPRRIRRLEPRL
jgi:hypothetical protein